MSEIDLVRGLRAGNDAAFEELVQGHGGRMLRVAKRFLRNEEDARDAVQDAFLAVVRSVGGFEAGSKLATWLHRITVNAALMKLRAQSRRPEEESIEPLLPRFRADGHQIESSVPWRGADAALEQAEHQAELQQLVHEAVDKLPESYRVVLLLRDIEELTPEETAEALGVPKGILKVRLHRARQALRTLLDPYMRETTA
jgi:RNA polymerase sigma-70 factor, ECF subfamily